jgi:eukaryotic-like serine/threonine-protein kinase
MSARPHAAARPAFRPSSDLTPRAGERPASPAPRAWGRFRLLGRIGKGAFGEVYRAFDTHLNHEVALKLSASDRWPNAHALRESRNLARVRHPNVVALYDAGTSEGRVGLWMELIRGATLSELLRNFGSFSAGEATIIGEDLCRALAAVHAAGLIHGDIKAQNVMREHGGRVVLMDFGASQGFDETCHELGRLTGTPVYLAPEVLSGGDPTIATDIYSLGVLLFHLVTCDYPVQKASVEELREAHRRGHVRRLDDLRPSLPEVFVTAIQRALDSNPDKRYGSADEMQAAMSHVLSQLPASASRSIDELDVASSAFAAAPEGCAETTRSLGTEPTRTFRALVANLARSAAR